MESSSVKKASKQACDNCRRRKLKCNRANQCDKCHNALLSCTYSDVLQRKGPKVRTLGALSSLRPSSSSSASSPSDFGGHGHGHIANDVIRTVTSGHLHDADPTPSPTSTAIISTTIPTSSHPAYVGLESRGHAPFTGSLLHTSTPSPDDAAFGSPETLPCGPLQAQERLSSLVLIAHVNVFLKYLFPIMPVFQPDKVLLDSSNPDGLSPQRYAFIVSLCAATHIQLKLDGNEHPNITEDEMRPEGQAQMSGDSLLAEAVRARREYDPIEHSNIDNLLTSFFLFAAYGNMDQQDYAWFYLSQSVSLANTLGLHRELTYASLGSSEAEEKRRIFWLLFVTERAYALQQNKPIMLRSSIRKPEVFDSDDPILSYGFLNLINLFEKLTVDLYDWISTGSEDGLSGITLTGSIQTSLCSPISLDGVLETQQVDILVTQQWLQAVMWRLAMSRSLQKSSGNDGLLPFHFPVTVGKSVLGVLASVSQSSIDAHGIGMEQKLFDVGTCVGDVARSLRAPAALRVADSTIDPKELLWGILTSLSSIRGSQSYLFPALLERSGSVLGLESPSISKNPSLTPLDTLCIMGTETKNDYRQIFSIDEDHDNDDEYRQEELIPRQAKSPQNVFQNLLDGPVPNI